MTIHIVLGPPHMPPEKVADAELHFDDTDGLLSGLKLVGFTVWQRGGQLKVTFPSRQYTVRHERRTYGLLRELTGTGTALRAAILVAYRQAKAAV